MLNGKRAYPCIRFPKRLRRVRWPLLASYAVPIQYRLDIEEVDRYTRLNPWYTHPRLEGICLGSVLSRNTREEYKKRLHNLLWVEEAHMSKWVRQYDRKKVSIEVAKDFIVNESMMFAHDQELSRISVVRLSLLYRRSPQIIDLGYNVDWNRREATLNLASRHHLRMGVRHKGCRVRRRGLSYRERYAPGSLLRGFPSDVPRRFLYLLPHGPQ